MILTWLSIAFGIKPTLFFTDHNALWALAQPPAPCAAPHPVPSALSLLAASPFLFLRQSRLFPFSALWPWTLYRLPYRPARPSRSRTFLIVQFLGHILHSRTRLPGWPCLRWYCFCDHSWQLFCYSFTFWLTVFSHQTNRLPFSTTLPLSGSNVVRKDEPLFQRGHLLVERRNLPTADNSGKGRNKKWPMFSFLPLYRCE